MRRSQLSWIPALRAGMTILRDGMTILQAGTTMLGDRMTILQAGTTMLGDWMTILQAGMTILGDGMTILGGCVEVVRRGMPASRRHPVLLAEMAMLVEGAEAASVEIAVLKFVIPARKAGIHDAAHYGARATPSHTEPRMPPAKSPDFLGQKRPPREGRP